MIDSSVNWFLGGVTVSLGTSSELYNSERNSANVYDGHAFTTNSVGVTTSIALMYASDYGYAAPASCVNGIGDYDSIDNCKGNWLNSNSKYKEWLLTVLYTDEAYVLLKHTSGQVDNSGSYYGYAIRPVLYLKEDVYHLSGDGTPTNPYVIGM